MAAASAGETVYGFEPIRKKAPFFQKLLPIPGEVVQYEVAVLDACVIHLDGTKEMLSAKEIVAIAGSIPQATPTPPHDGMVTEANHDNRLDAADPRREPV